MLDFPNGELEDVGRGGVRQEGGGMEEAKRAGGEGVVEIIAEVEGCEMGREREVVGREPLLLGRGGRGVECRGGQMRAIADCGGLGGRVDVREKEGLVGLQRLEERR